MERRWSFSAGPPTPGPGSLLELGAHSAAKCGIGRLALGLSDEGPSEPPGERLNRSVASDVEARADFRQQSLRPRQLKPSKHLLHRVIALVADVQGLLWRGTGELVGAPFELLERRLRLIESQVLDPRAGPNRQRPGHVAMISRCQLDLHLVDRAEMAFAREAVTQQAMDRHVVGQNRGL